MWWKLAVALGLGIFAAEKLFPKTKVSDPPKGGGAPSPTGELGADPMTCDKIMTSLPPELQTSIGIAIANGDTSMLEVLEQGLRDGVKSGKINPTVGTIAANCIRAQIVKMKSGESGSVFTPPTAPPVYTPPTAPPVYTPPVYTPPTAGPPVYAPPVFSPPSGYDPSSSSGLSAPTGLATSKGGSSVPSWSSLLLGVTGAPSTWPGLRGLDEPLRTQALNTVGKIDYSKLMAGDIYNAFWMLPLLPLDAQIQALRTRVNALPGLTPSRGPALVDIDRTLDAIHRIRSEQGI